MVFTHKEFDENLVVNIYKYIPYRNSDGTVNEGFNRDSGLILDVKDGKAEAISHFYNKLDPNLKKRVHICYVPSSNSGNKQSGIRTLAQKLAANSRIDATHCLDRYKSIQKAAHGGERSKEVHFNSIRVLDPSLIQNKDILLLDDITTSEISLRACKELLLNNGARTVLMLALGKTKRD